QAHPAALGSGGIHVIEMLEAGQIVQVAQERHAVPPGLLLGASGAARRRLTKHAHRRREESKSGRLDDGSAGRLHLNTPDAPRIGQSPPKIPGQLCFAIWVAATPLQLTDRRRRGTTRGSSARTGGRQRASPVAVAAGYASL